MNASPGAAPDQQPTAVSVLPSQLLTEGLLRRPLDSAEYTADLFEQACKTLRVSQSMGRVGSCFDNAAAESFFSTLEWELFRLTHFDTKQNARRQIARFIDWYNRVRRHSSCEMKPPVEFEAILAARAAETVPVEEAA